MTSMWKNVYIDKLDDIFNKYNNAVHTTIKMKPIDVKDNWYIDFTKEVNDKEPKFKVDDHVYLYLYDLLILLVDHLLKARKEFKTLKKYEILAIFTKMKLIKLAFSMIWLMGILKI